MKLQLIGGSFIIWTLCLFSRVKGGYRCPYGKRNITEGVHARVKRVIGGSEAIPNSWPWIVSFTDKDNRQQCAGTIIDREWILTAAHCFLYSVEPHPIYPYTYRAADHRLNFTDSREYNVDISKVFIHPEYVTGDTKSPGDYDIALVKLTEPLNYTDYVQPVCLARKQDIFNQSDSCYLIGWGNVYNTKEYNRSLTLQEVKLPYVDLEECNSNTSYKGVVSDRFLCAGLKEGGIDGCYGDSGGSYQCERNGTWIQVGIMIWGLGCAEPTHYGVYTDVRVLEPFIEAIMTGPNSNLTSYYMKNLEEIRPNLVSRNSSNLHELLTKESEFSDIDLVRNLQLLPHQIDSLNKTTLINLIFVSSKQNLTMNTTKLAYIAHVVVEQAERLYVYYRIVKIEKEFNITFEDIRVSANLTKDGLLNSSFSAIENIRKQMYINKHVKNLEMYRDALISHKPGVSDNIIFNVTRIRKDLDKPADDLKKLNKKSVKQILVKYNQELFTKMLSIRNISSFFEISLETVKNTTVSNVLGEYLNINLSTFASLNNLTHSEIDVFNMTKISTVPYPDDRSLYSLVMKILEDHAARFACGIRNLNQRSRSKRVIGGHEARENSWPWIVNFIDSNNSRQYCAGTIINRKWILTAAHCFILPKSILSLSDYTYHVGDHRLNFTDPHEYAIDAFRLFIHPDFDTAGGGPGDNDIALIELARPLTYSENVRPVCLVEDGQTFVNASCYVTGWGNNINMEGYHRSPVLKQAKVDSVSLDECNSNTSYNGIISDRFICYGFKEGGIDACYGDSGGPLQCERNGSWVQIGIVSWGQECAQPNYYGVYANVEALLSFVNAVISGPNSNLTSYYMKNLEEIRPNLVSRNSSNLHELLTKESEFSDIDLVRNLQLLPHQIDSLNKTTLINLIFVSSKQNLTMNTTKLAYIAHVVVEQAERLYVYYRIVKIEKEFNITFEDIRVSANLTKDGLLNSSFSAIENIRKQMYINKHVKNLEMYRDALISHKPGVSDNIIFNVTRIRKDLDKPADDLKKLNKKSVKQILVKYNQELFTKMLSIRNISSFFEISLETVKNTTVSNVLGEYLNINLSTFASLNNLTHSEIDVFNMTKISTVPYPDDRSLYSLVMKILEDHAARFACGIRNLNQRSRSKRVIGGHEARENSWPWIVNFIDSNNSRQYCAGTIINRKWILTAAHCFILPKSILSLSDYTYHVGDHRLNFTDPHEYTIDAFRLFIHPDFDTAGGGPGDNDIALIELARPLTYSENVRPVCLVEDGQTFVNASCYVTGWGNNINMEGYNRSSVLRQAKVDSVSLDECNSNTSYNGIISDRFICYGFKEGGTDACYGDSGGPLQCERNGSWVQIGIVSWGQECAQPNYYGVYANVEAFLSFVNAVISGPNMNLTNYYLKTLEEVIPKMSERQYKNLHELLTKNEMFSTLDLVRNIQLLPYQGELLNKTTLKDLIFVSEASNLTRNETMLRYIAKTFLHQANRLTMYMKGRELAKELNTSFDKVIQLSRLTKQAFLDSTSEVLEQVRKTVQIDKHLAELEKYKNNLMTYKDDLNLQLDVVKIRQRLVMRSLGAIQNITKKELQQMLVRQNEMIFTRTLSIRNISKFFNISRVSLQNTTVSYLLMDVLNITLSSYGELYMFDAHDLDVIKSERISTVPSSEHKSLYEISKTIIQRRDAKNAECIELPDSSISCRCKKGYVGNGYNCDTGNTVFNSELVLNQTFTESLNNPNSIEYRNLAEKIENILTNGIRKDNNLQGFLGCQVTGFKDGSIIAQYILIFQLQDGVMVNVSKLSQVINTVVKDGSLPVSQLPQSITATDLCSLGFHNCDKDAICSLENGIVTCTCKENYHGDGERCIDPCENHECSANSHCIRGLNKKAICRCDPGYAQEEDGCKKSDEDYKTALIIVCCVAGTLLLLTLMVCWYQYCNKNRKKSLEMNQTAVNNDVGKANTGFDSIDMENL